MQAYERTLFPATLILAGGLLVQAAGRGALERASEPQDGGADPVEASPAQAAGGQVLAPTPQGPGPKGSGLERVDPLDEAAGSGRAEVLEDWRERLLDTDLARREQSFERLILAVRRNPSLAGVLREWASDGRRVELAWTARMALRELSRPPSFGLHGHLIEVPGGSAGLVGPGSTAVPEVPVAPVAPFDQGAPGTSGTHGTPGSGGARHGTEGGGASVPIVGGDVAEGFSVVQFPHGVLLEVRMDRGGQLVTERYQGATLEEVLAANPRVREHLTARRSGMPRVSLSGGGGSWSSTALDPPQPWSFGPALRTDVLGVRVHQPTELELKRAGRSPASPAPGLMIDRVEPDTIAESMGLRPGELLVALNGTGLAVPKDIPRGLDSLSEAGGTGELRAVVVDAYGRSRSLTWRPAPDPAGSAGR